MKKNKRTRELQLAAANARADVLAELEAELWDWRAKNIQFEHEAASAFRGTSGYFTAIQARERRVAINKVLKKIDNLKNGFTVNGDPRP